MVSVALRPFASLELPPALKFADGSRVRFSFKAVYHQLSSFFGKKKIKISIIPADEVGEEWPQGKIPPRDEYEEEVEYHDTLLPSIFTPEIFHNPSSSLQDPTVADNQLSRFEDEVENYSFCEICLENKESWQMFTNDKCSHSFCNECTSIHITTKIQETNKKEISCPAINCKAVLNYDVCRLMIPNETLVRWDELLCMSLIPESQRIYCPFRDCSAMLINDTGKIEKLIECLVCNRTFCGGCRVPWHSEFTCEEFQKLYGKKRGKGDRILRVLAKKKRWQKCPRCKMYVEKAEGCLHITCRCSYEFCYRCGGKWTDKHPKCQPKRWTFFNSSEASEEAKITLY